MPPTNQIVYLISVLTLYYLKYVDFGQIVLYTIWFVGGIGLAYLGYRMQDRAPVHGSNEEKRRFRIAYIMLGGVIGLATAFFGTVFLTVISINLGGPNFTKIIDEPWEIISLITTLTVLGAFAGYYLGKRNNFNKSKWMAKIDEKLGF